MILKTELRASLLKGQWQVHRSWPSSGKGLMDLMHINELGGQHGLLSDNRRLSNEEMMNIIMVAG